MLLYHKRKEVQSYHNIRQRGLEISSRGPGDANLVHVYVLLRCMYVFVTHKADMHIKTNYKIGLLLRIILFANVKWLLKCDYKNFFFFLFFFYFIQFKSIWVIRKLYCIFQDMGHELIDAVK